MYVLYMNVHTTCTIARCGTQRARPDPTLAMQHIHTRVFKLSLGTLFTEPVEIMKRYWILVCFVHVLLYVLFLLAAPRCFFVITHVEWNAVLLVKSCQATPASNFKYQNLRISYRFLSISHVSMKSTTSNRSAKINHLSQHQSQITG